MLPILFNIFGIGNQKYLKKFEKRGFRESKYNLFKEHYPIIPLQVIFMESAGISTGHETLSS